jgi:Phage gp6-like head-tail connector protein
VAGLQIENPPQVEPILLTDMKNYLKVDFTQDDTLIQMMITAARELIEGFTGRSIVNKDYVMVGDSFPYFVDSVMSQLAYPPSYYSLPRYSTTLWNYSQMIKLWMSPVVKINRIIYLGTDAQYHTMSASAVPWRPATAYVPGNQVLDGNGNLQTALNIGTSDLQPPNTINSPISSSQLSNVSWATAIGAVTIEATGMQWSNAGPAPFSELAPGSTFSNTFFLDTIGEPGRIFPGPAGSFWPPVMYVPNAVEIHFRAGYGDAVSQGSPVSFLPPATPSPDGYYSRLVIALQQTVATWYESRESISPLAMKELPNHCKQLLWSARIFDVQPTRG